MTSFDGWNGRSLCRWCRIRCRLLLPYALLLRWRRRLLPDRLSWRRAGSLLPCSLAVILCRNTARLVQIWIFGL